MPLSAVKCRNTEVIVFASGYSLRMRLTRGLTLVLYRVDLENRVRYCSADVVVVSVDAFVDPEVGK